MWCNVAGVLAIICGSSLQQPAGTNQRPTVPDLSRASRVFIERKAPHYFIASDGSLWTREVEAQHDDEHDPERLDAFDRDGAPLWYSPTLSADHEFTVYARSKENALEVLAQLDYATQVDALREDAVRSNETVLIRAFEGSASLKSGLVGRFVPESGPVSASTVFLTSIPHDVEIREHSFHNRYVLIRRAGSVEDPRAGKRATRLDAYEIVDVATLKSPLEYGIRPVHDADELTRLLYQAEMTSIPDWKLVRVKIKDATTEHVRIELEGDGVLRRRKTTRTGGGPPVFEWQWSLAEKPLRWQKPED